MSVIHQPRTSDLDARHLLFPVGLGIAFLVLFGRLWYLQVVMSDSLATKAEQFRITSAKSLAPRGLIFDRNHVLLAGVQPVIVVTAIPAQAQKNPWVIEKLSHMLNTPIEKLQERVQNAFYKPFIPATIFVGAPIDIATRIAEAGGKLPGIGVESQPMRYYTDPEEFSHVLGYVWTPSEQDEKRLKELSYKPPDYVGKVGLEYFYEPELMGTEGGERFEIDAKRRPLRMVGKDNSQPGKRLILSIDSCLQKFAGDLLKSYNGAAVALDPRTGEVLALVSEPTYDTSQFLGGISSTEYELLSKDESFPLMNRAISASYAPGSTFKIVNTLAAMQAGTFSAGHTYPCPGFYMVGKRKVACLGHHGVIAFKKAFEDSCNTYFADQAIRAGGDALKAMADQVGLGQKTGIDLRSESRGIVPNEEWIKRWRNPPKWYAGDTVNLALGQGEISITPIQMAQLGMLVANRGVAYRPHIVHGFETPGSDGQFEAVNPEVAQTVNTSPSNWNTLIDAMVGVVEEGTAKRGRIEGVTWAGKTGSAENRKNKKTHSWFVGFAPAKDPKIVIAVVAENAGHGSDVAVPIASQIVRAYLSGNFPAATPNDSTDALAQSAPAVSPRAR